MKKRAGRSFGWRVAVAIAAVAALLLGTSITQAAVADDGPLSSFTKVGVPQFLTPVVGETIAAGTDGWSPTPDSFTYQWYLNSTAIDSATDRLYTVTPDDQGG